MLRLVLIAPLLCLLAAACGDDADSAGDGAAGTSPPTSTPATDLMPNVPRGSMSVDDPAGDVQDVRGEPVGDARPSSDLRQAELTLTDSELVLRLVLNGAVPAALQEGEEIWWALELDTVTPHGTAHRVTVVLGESTWEVINWDPERGGIALDVRPAIDEDELSVSIPLTRFPRLDGPFRWYVASIWGGMGDLTQHGFGDQVSYGDRAPDGDALAFEDQTGR